MYRFVLYSQEEALSGGIVKYEPREVRGNPSSKSVTVCYERYLSSPLFIDAEYMRFYTERHKEVSFWEEQEKGPNATLTRSSA